MKNGFFHIHPDDYDIWLTPEMEQATGLDRINWHVENIWHENYEMFAYVNYGERTFVAKRFEQGADHYWEIFREEKYS